MLSNGSSRKRTSGEWITAAANATRLRIPVEYSERVFEVSVSSNASSSSVTRLACVGFIEAEHARHEGQELVGVQRIEQAEGFRHHADTPLDGCIVRVEALAKQFDLSGSGIQQAGHAADGGALARAVGAEEAEHGAGANGEGKVLDG